MEFENKTISLIDKAISEMSAFENDDLYVEMLQHLNACKSYVHHFQGRGEVIDAVRQYIVGPSTHPFMIYGHSGSGKTSVLAKAASLARSWLPDTLDMAHLKSSVSLRHSRTGRSGNTEMKSKKRMTKSQIQPPTGEPPQESAILMIRFLGTSPGTSSIRQTLKYLCWQLALWLACGPQEQVIETTADMDPEAISSIDDFQQVVTTFYSLLEKSSSTGRWVLIFLDAIDQLDPSDGAYNLDWIRTPLPEHVRLVISTLPDVGDILKSFNNRFIDSPSAKTSLTDASQKTDIQKSFKTEEPQSIEVTALDCNMCEQILEARLESQGRQLQPFQWRLVRRAFQKCRVTIFVVLVLRVVLQWRSWHLPKRVRDNPDEQTEAESPCSEEEALKAIGEWPNLELALNVRDAITKLFVSLEFTHGKLFTSRALAYITASRNGLSETEVVDILSLDDDVLRDVFQHHLPPQTRAPPFVWARLRSSIGGNLAEREVDGISVIFWYHRQFIEAAQEYFLGNMNIRTQIHSTMADYFMGKWANQKKPFTYPKYLVRKLGLPKSSDEDRAVPAQPYVFEEKGFNSEGVHLNLRKLNELPWHLVHSGRMDEFYSEIAFNYEFLVNKLRGTSRSQLLTDLYLPHETYQRFLEDQRMMNEAKLHSNSDGSEHRIIRRGGLRFSVLSSTELDTTNWEPQLPIPELNLMYNSVRIAALSLNANPLSLAIDLLGRLSRMPVAERPVSAALARRTSIFHRKQLKRRQSVRQSYPHGSRKTEHQRLHHHDYMDRLLIKCRFFGHNDCALLPRTFCLDSGSGLVHTTFDLGIGIGCVMSNRQILSVPISGGSFVWFDLNGNMIKTMPHPAANFLFLKFILRMHNPGPVNLNLFPINVSTTTTGTRDNNASTAGETEPEQTKEDGKLLQIAEVDYLSGRVTELCQLNAEWSARFSMSNTELLMDDWIASIQDECLCLGNWRSKRMVVTDSSLLNKVFWASELLRKFTFVLKSGAFALDMTSHRLARIPASTDSSIFSVIVLPSDRVVCFTRTNKSDLALMIYETVDGKSEINSEHEANEQSNMTDETTEFADDEVDLTDLKTWSLKLEQTLPLVIPENLRVSRVTSHPNKNGEMVAYLFQARRKNVDGLGVIWHVEREEFVDLQVPTGNLDSDELSTEQLALNKSIMHHTKNFGKDTNALFSEECDLLFTSGIECFLLVWSTETGDLLRIISQGGAEGIIAGVAPSLPTINQDTQTTTGSESESMIAVCHFPDQSDLQYGESPDKAIFITCKVYHVSALREPDKELYRMGSRLYADDTVGALPTADNSTSLNKDTQSTGEPLIFEPAYINTEYVYNDALPTMVLAAYKKESRFETDSLVLYDLDDDSHVPVHCWSEHDMNSHNLDAFISTEILSTWPSYGDQQHAFLNTTMNRIKVLTVYNVQHSNEPSVSTQVFLDPGHMELYMPHLYLLTSQGTIHNFGFLNSQDGILALVRTHTRQEGKLIVDVLRSDPVVGLKSVWENQLKVIDLNPALRLVQRAEEFVLDGRELEEPVVCQISQRPNHPSQLLVGLSESHKSMHPVTRDDGRPVVWLGAVVLIELNYNGHVTNEVANNPYIVRTFLLDYGPKLILLPDGETLINYRLNKYGIDSGTRMEGFADNGMDKLLNQISNDFIGSPDRLKKKEEEEDSSSSGDGNDELNEFDISKFDFSNLDPVDEQTFLLDMHLMCDGKLIVAKKHHPEQQLFLDFEEESSDSDDEAYGASPARSLVAFKTECLTQMANYMLENEPYMLWSNEQMDTLILVTSNEYMRGFDVSIEYADRRRMGLLSTVQLEDVNLDDSDDDAESYRSSRSIEQDPEKTEKEETLALLDYLHQSGLSEALQQAMLQITNRRPLDPITMLADCLRKQCT